MAMVINQTVIKTFVIVSFTVIVGFSVFISARAQVYSPSLMTLKGYVIGSEEGTSLGGTHIFARRTRRGFICNSKGYFDIRVLPGDTLIFSHIGFETAKIIASGKAGETLDILVRMKIKPIELAPLTFEAEDDIAYLKRSELERRTSPWYVAPRDSGEIDVPIGSTDYGLMSRFSREAREKRKLVKIFSAEQADLVYTKTVSSDSVRHVFMDRYGLSRSEFDRFIIYFNSLHIPINRQSKTAIIESMHRIFLQYAYQRRNY
jgi:hypothetical protein